MIKYNLLAVLIAITCASEAQTFYVTGFAPQGTSVSADTTIQFTFDVAMNVNSITNLIVGEGGLENYPQGGDWQPVSGQWVASVSDTVFTFTPDQSFAPGALVMCEIPTSVLSAAGGSFNGTRRDSLESFIVDTGKTYPATYTYINPMAIISNTYVQDEVTNTVDHVLPMGLTVPQTVDPCPVIFWVHGGSFTGSGSLTNSTAGSGIYPEYLSEKLGIAVVGVAWRSTLSQGTFTKATNDIDTAIQYITDNAQSLNIDTSRMALYGGSAGTPMSALVSQANTNITCYIGFNGSYNFFNGYKSSGGGSFETDEPSTVANSAIFQIRTNNPTATLLLHGTDDPLISPNQSVWYAEAINKKIAGMATVLLYEDEEHAYYDDPPARNPNIVACAEFLSQYLDLGIYPHKDDIPPAAPVGLAPTAGDGSVSLDWNDNSEWDHGSYSVYRSTNSGSYGAALATGVSTSDYIDSTAVNGTTYYYVVTASDTNSNESAQSSEVFIVPTSGADLTPPAAPTGLDTTAGDGSVSLDWANNGEEDIAGYNVYRSTTSSSYGSALATNVSISAYVDSTAVNGPTYYYVVTATDTNSNESAQSSEVSEVPTDIPPPGLVTSINRIWDSGYTVDLTAKPYSGWGYATDGLDGGFDNTQSGTVAPAANLVSSSGSTSDFGWTFKYSDGTGPTAATRQMSSGDLGGMGNGDGWDLTFTNIVSSTETRRLTLYLGARASLPGDDRIDITISSTLTGGSADETGTQKIYSNFDGTNYYYVATAVYTVEFTSATETDLVLNFRASNTTGTRGAGVSGYTLETISGGVDTTAPAAPTGLAATAGDGSVSLDWNDSGAGDLAGYSVYRSTSSGSYSNALVTGLNTSDYTDNIVVNGTTYYYVVTATDTNSNESVQSIEDSATPWAPDAIAPAAPTGLTATAGEGTVSLDWNNNGETDLASYSVYRSTNSGSYGAALATGLSDSDYVDSTAVNGTTYFYVVTATDTSSNKSSISNEDSATPVDAPPAAPTGLAAAAGDGSVSLDWNDNSEGDLDSYSVYRSTTSNSYTTALTTGVSSSEYVDSTVENSTTYYYVVTATDTNSNESSQSSEVSVTPEATATEGIVTAITPAYSSGSNVDLTSPSYTAWGYDVDGLDDGFSNIKSGTTFPGVNLVSAGGTTYDFGWTFDEGTGATTSSGGLNGMANGEGWDLTFTNIVSSQRKRLTLYLGAFGNQPGNDRIDITISSTMTGGTADETGTDKTYSNFDGVSYYQTATAVYTIEFSSATETDLVLNFRASNTAGGRGAGVSGYTLEVISGAPLTGYELWVASWSNSIGAATNDFDSDGVNNLYEYALDGNPTNGLIQGTMPYLTNTGSGLLYIHPQRSDDTNLTYWLETTTNLVSGTWTNAGTTVSGINVTSNTLDFVTNDVDTTENEGFIRLKIEQ